EGRTVSAVPRRARYITRFKSLNPWRLPRTSVRQPIPETAHPISGAGQSLYLRSAMPSFRCRAVVAISSLLFSASVFGQDRAIAPQAPPNAIPEGTRFLIRLNDKLDTRSLQAGKHFKAKLAEDLVAGNGAVIPRGKTIKGHVSSVSQGLHARLMLSFDEI